MANYFQLRPEGPFAVIPVDSDRQLRRELFSRSWMTHGGCRLSPVWPELRHELFRDNRVWNGSTTSVDFPTTEAFVCFGKRAIDVLEPLLTENGELLPIKTNVGEFWLLNILSRRSNLIDCERSKARPIEGKAPAVFIPGRTVFKPSSDDLPAIFRPDESPASAVLVNDEFVAKVSAAKLMGMAFHAA